MQLSSTDSATPLSTPESILLVPSCSSQEFTRLSTALPYRLRNEETLPPSTQPSAPPSICYIVPAPNNPALGEDLSMCQIFGAMELEDQQLPSPQALSIPSTETICSLKDHTLTLTKPTKPFLRDGSLNYPSGESCYDTVEPHSPLTNDSRETPQLTDSSNSPLSAASNTTPNLARQQYKAREGVLWESAKTLLEDSFIYPAHLTEAEFETLVCNNACGMKAWINENLPRLIHRAVGQWFTANQKLRSAGISPSNLSEEFLDVFEWMTSAEQDFFTEQYNTMDRQAFGKFGALRLTARQRRKLMAMAGSRKEDYLKAYDSFQQGSPRGNSDRSSESFRSNVETLKKANQKRLQVLQERIRTLEKIEHSIRRFDSLRLSMESSKSSDTDNSTFSYISLDTRFEPAISSSNSKKVQASHDTQKEQLIVRKRGSRDCEGPDSAQAGKRLKHCLSLRPSSLGSTPFATEGFPIRRGDYVEDNWDRLEHLIYSTTPKPTKMPSAPNFTRATGECYEKTSRNRSTGILTPRMAPNADDCTITNDHISIKDQAAQPRSWSRLSRSTSSDPPESVFVTNLGIAWPSTHLTLPGQVENQKSRVDPADIEITRQNSGINMETNSTTFDRSVTMQVIKKKSSMTTIMSACSSSANVVMKNVPCATPDLSLGDARSTHGILEDPRYSQEVCESLYQEFEHGFGASIYPTLPERKQSVRKKLSRFFGSLRSKGKAHEVNF